jgi:hypothetical protein
VQRELLARDLDRLAHRAADLGVNAQDIHEQLDAAFSRVAKERATAKKGRSQ